MRTEGSIRLAKVDLSQAMIAGRLDVTPAIVCGWLSGKRRPSVVSRSAIEEVFQIPAASWDVAKPETAPHVISVPSPTPATSTPVVALGASLTAAEKILAYERIVDRCIEEARMSPIGSLKDNKV